MPLSSTYYDTLKTQLEQSANSKKAAYDAALLRATSAQFDAQGRLTGYKDNAPGTLDVQQMEKTRNIGIQGEQSGMLRSGQYARDLATSQAEYRQKIVDLGAETEASKTAVDTDTGTELAKYKAMYDMSTPATGGNASNVSTSKPSAPSSPPITAPPVFKPPVSAPVTVAPSIVSPNKPIAPKETVSKPAPKPVQAPKKPTPPPPPPPPPKKPTPAPVPGKVARMK